MLIKLDYFLQSFDFFDMDRPSNDSDCWLATIVAADPSTLSEFAEDLLFNFEPIKPKEDRFEFMAIFWNESAIKCWRDANWKWQKFEF